MEKEKNNAKQKNNEKDVVARSPMENNTVIHVICLHAHTLYASVCLPTSNNGVTFLMNKQFSMVNKLSVRIAHCTIGCNAMQLWSIVQCTIRR